MSIDFSTRETGEGRQGSETAIWTWCEILNNYRTYDSIHWQSVLQFIGTVKRTIFKKVRKETILKIYNTLVLLTFLYGSENWTLTALQRRRIEVAEMKTSGKLHTL